MPGKSFPAQAAERAGIAVSSALNGVFDCFSFGACHATVLCSLMALRNLEDQEYRYGYILQSEYYIYMYMYVIYIYIFIYTYVYQYSSICTERS